jgi:hypothetical protein
MFFDEGQREVFVDGDTTCLAKRSGSGQKKTGGLARHDGKKPFDISFRTQQHVSRGKY